MNIQRVFYLFAFLSLVMAGLVYFDFIPGIKSENKEMLIFAELIGALMLILVGRFLPLKR